jgi:hypothetical protein
MLRINCSLQYLKRSQKISDGGRRLTTHSTGRAISVSFIENLSVAAACARRLIRALDTLRMNKTAKACVVQTRRTEAALKAFDDGRSNNSLNASGISLDVIRKVEGFSQFFPPR